MKHKIILFVLICLSAPALFAQTNTEEQKILRLSSDKWQWMAGKNADSLNALFDEKSMFVHMAEAGARPRN